jgi:hypothetical protein
MSPEKSKTYIDLGQIDPQILNFIEEKFSDHPKLDDIKEIISRFSPNGQIVMSSYLVYSLEDDVFDKAWEVLNTAYEEHFSFQHPDVLGDPDAIKSNALKITGMFIDAGIKWPRSETT